MSVLILSTTFVKNTCNPKKNSLRYHKCIQVLMRTTCYSCKISVRLEFSQQISENPQISHFIKIHHWEPSCAMQRDRQMDMMKPIVAFRNFGNVPKNTEEKM
jgi:hypothetical protein